MERRVRGVTNGHQFKISTRGKSDELSLFLSAELSPFSAARSLSLSITLLGSLLSLLLSAPSKFVERVFREWPRYQSYFIDWSHLYQCIMWCQDHNYFSFCTILPSELI